MSRKQKRIGVKHNLEQFKLTLPYKTESELASMLKGTYWKKLNPTELKLAKSENKRRESHKKKHTKKLKKKGVVFEAISDIGEGKITRTKRGHTTFFNVTLAYAKGGAPLKHSFTTDYSSDEKIQAAKERAITYLSKILKSKPVSY